MPHCSLNQREACSRYSGASRRRRSLTFSGMFQKLPFWPFALPILHPCDAVLSIIARVPGFHKGVPAAGMKKYPFAGGAKAKGHFIWLKRRGVKHSCRP